ncbi:MAG TPA: threonylcarbamoyl-AMP synthase [Syntrophaceae bacterium]|nr:threonylcarbamoyl-AMP synthase [Syntrophaceae bacterium]
MLIKINPLNPQRRLINKAVKVLEQGGIISYPTDTYYGMGCDLFNRKGIEKIYHIKKRSKHKPFSFICSNLKNISEYANVSNYAYRTLKRLLPGPYTFILEGSRLVPKIMLTKRKTVGIRVPDNKICLAIVEALGRPIISSSAGLSDREILSDPKEIEDTFGPLIDLVVDGGILISQPSTVISLIDDIPEIIRVGKGDISTFL